MLIVSRMISINTLCTIIVFLAYLFATFSPAVAITGYWTNEFASQKYSQWFYPNCKIQQGTSSKASVAIINPTFTAAAYNHAFYDFYNKYNYYLNSGLVRNVTNDLNLLTSRVPNATIHTPLNDFIKPIPQHIQNLFSGEVNLCVLTDGDLQKRDASLESSDIGDLHKLFDVVILFHEEYVTPKLYDIFKKFVSDGGTLLVISGNIFYAEVRYDENNNTVTLVNGHGFAFNNKTAFRGLIERWENETQKWVGSNFYHFALPQYLLRYYNNPFNISGPEINYINNKNARTILDYNSSDLRYPIVAYELKYGSGKVISTGVQSNVIRYPNFLKFFDDLLVNHANPKNVSLTHHIPSFYSPPYKPRLSATNNNGFIFNSVGNQSENQVRIGTVINDTSSGTDLFGIIGNAQIFRIIGNTENKTIHFLTQPLHYTGDTIDLTVGDVLKYGNSSQYYKYDNPVTLLFTLKGNKSEYKVAFVQGKFSKEGWDQNGTFYVNIPSHSSSSINLHDLLEQRNDTYSELTKMEIVLPPSTVVNPFDFQVNIVA